MIEQEKNFIKSIADSIISLKKIENYSYDEFDNLNGYNPIKGHKVVRYTIELKTGKYIYNILSHRIPKYEFHTRLIFLNKKYITYDYLLSISIKEDRGNWSSYNVGSYEYKNEHGLDLIFDKLDSLHKQKKLDDQNKSFIKFNEDLLKIIDVSVTRDAKLGNILDENIK